MIQNISSFYNSSERVSYLLVKISNQIIKSCKRYITEGGRVNIWTAKTSTIEKKLGECIRLNDQYREAYHHVKNKIDNMLSQKFSFSEKQIFGRFDCFCERLKNLLVMFQKISLYNRLFDSKLESLLPDESIEEDRKSYENAVRILTMKEYDYLDYRNKYFDKDFIDFLNRLENISEKMKKKLDVAYNEIWDTPHAFQYLHKFKKLSKIIPLTGMTSKKERMIITFKKEMERVSNYFNKNKNFPLVARDYPDNPGRIYWVRSLVERIKYFIDHLEEEGSFKKIPTYRKLVRQYNNTGVMLMKYEIQLEESLKPPRMKTMNTLLAQPVVRSVTGGKLLVNFDPILENFLHENKKLCKLDIKLSSLSHFLLTKKDWFHDFKDMISMMIDKYLEAVSFIHRDLKRLFNSHCNSLRAALDPALTDMNWSYKEWDKFVTDRLCEISHFTNFIGRVNNIYELRIESTLESIQSIPLYEIPNNQPWTVEVFLNVVENKCKVAAKKIDNKSRQVENAVDDIISLAMEGSEISKSDMKDYEEVFEDSYDQKSCVGNNVHYPKLTPLITVLDRQQLSSVNTAGKDLRKMLSRKVIEKLTLLIKTSLRTLAKNFDYLNTDSNDISKINIYPEDHDQSETLFVLNAFLSFPTVLIAPSIDELQNALNSAGKIMISVAKGVSQWKQTKKKNNNFSGLVPNSESKKEMRIYNPIKIEQPIIDEKM